jgi:23S rRNA pseudouridine1911/1915/1917 synthase
MKVSSADLVAILRRYKLADETTVPRYIDQIKRSNPGPTNMLVSFRFNKRRFYVLFDDTAEDDTAYVLQQVQTEKQDAIGEVVENPNDHITTYALPFKGKDVYLFMAVSDKKRLDVALAERFPETSRSTWQKHIKAGHVSVNREVVTSPKHDVTDTDAIAVAMPTATDHSSDELPILYIDDDVIVINKPVGVLAHSKGALNDEFTVADFFRRYSSFHNDSNRPGVVHRLDRDTSGVMIGARTPEAGAFLQKQFADRKAKKTYIAIVNGHPKLSQSRIELPIGRNPKAPSTFRVDAGGKPATTGLTVLDATDTQSLVELAPLTGRTHQLRVHMTYLGTPIVGDRVYGKIADRMYLHAHQLEITLPSGERRTFTAPLPSEFSTSFPTVKL